MRSDNGSVLGTAKRGYEVFDNAEMFRFLDSFATDGLRYHTAGALFNGERVWALASLEGSAVTLHRADGSPETLASFLLCVAGHDGAHAVTLQPTSVRVVCWNTLSATLREDQPMRYSVKHTASLGAKLERAREALVGAVEHTRQLAGLGQELDKQRMSPETFARFAQALVLSVEANTEREAEDKVRAELDGASERIKSRTENAVAALYGCFANGIGNGGQTRWDALNAVTEWIDHQRGARRRAVRQPSSSAGPRSRRGQVPALIARSEPSTC